ncbi:TlpA family protein disulfide reductase [Aeoliella sp. SH292]|uniref:TlpA family protein disulfide reductase n=1 Tax=Aeoliella sp. SH292 TaxID=3454464 RepID=UPI003F9A32F8
MAQKSTPGMALFVLVLVFASAVLIGQWRGRPQLPLPAPLPKANVGGWLNTSEPLTADALKGKWVVVDAWATWCGPCMASMPELAEFRSRWPGDEVIVIGIAEDAVKSLVQESIDTVPGFDWPVAYGGGNAQMALGVRGLPTLILFDPAGKEVARVEGMSREEGGSIGQLEKIIADSGQ